MKTLKLSLLGIFAFITPVLFYVQAAKLADEKNKKNTSDTINIRMRYEHLLSIESLKYSDSLKSKQIEYLNKLLDLIKHKKPAMPPMGLSNIQPALQNIETTLNSIRINSENTNNSLLKVQSYLNNTNRYLFQIDSLINVRTFKGSNQAGNRYGDIKDSVIIKSVQNEMNMEIEKLFKIRDDLLLLQSNLRRSTLQRGLNQKDISTYVGLKNIDSLQSLIINRPYKMYFEQR